MANESLYKKEEREPQYGETQEIEAQEAAAPVPEEEATPEAGTVTEVAPTAPTLPTEIAEGETAGEEEEGITAAINPGTSVMPPLGDNYEEASYTLSNEKTLAIALLGRPSITMMTRRLAMALMQETGGLDNVETYPYESAIDTETLGQEPEQIAMEAGIESSSEGET